MNRSPFYVWYGDSREVGSAVSPLHTHVENELLYILEGEVEMRIAGKTYRLVPGQVAVVNAIEIHDLTPLQYPYRRIGIQITDGRLQQILGTSPIASALLQHGDRFHPVFDLATVREEAEALLWGIHREYTDPAVMHEEMLIHKLYAWLILLYRACPERFEGRHPDPVIGFVCEDIDRRFGEELSVEKYAKKCFFSTQYFIRRFRRAVGYTPGRYILLRRLAESRVLLKTTDLPVAAVGVKCGFGDVNGFVRSFRKETGITPGQYRRQALHEELQM